MEQELSDRKKQILKMIIDAYIDTGEPVGSKFLTQGGKMQLSSATVRNEMSELEDMGYLDKPHTSAGRIPSTTGYRFYVDRLMEDYRLNMEELELLNDLTKYKVSEIDRLIDRAGKVMSGVTRYAAVSLASKSNCTTVSRFDAVYIDSRSFLLVMITTDGEVKTGVIPSASPLSEEDTKRIKAALNSHLVNVPLDVVQLQTVFGLEEELGRLRTLATPILRAAYNATQVGGFENVKVDGVTNLLEYPEFADIDKIKSLMNVFEQHTGTIKEIIASPNTEEVVLPSAATDIDGGMKIYIGDKSENSVFSDASLVFCSVPMGGTNAVIGVLGPRRMDYKKVISSLKYFASGLESMAKSENENGKPPSLPDKSGGEQKS